MAKFKLQIDTGNGAFGDWREAEIIKILKKVIDKIEQGKGLDQKLMDSNGNSVGKCTHD
jgi:hypothetical protein